MRVTYTEESINDLTRLRKFIEEKNPIAAQRAAFSILKGIDQLTIFPYLGVEVSQAPNPKMIRDLVIDHYIVRYLIQSDEINILRVWHQKENRL